MLDPKAILARLRGKTPTTEAPATKPSGKKLAEKVVMVMRGMPVISPKPLTLYREVNELKENEYHKPIYTDSEGFKVGIRPEIIVEINTNQLDPRELKKLFQQRYEEMRAEGWIIERSNASNPHAIKAAEKGA